MNPINFGSKKPIFTIKLEKDVFDLPPIESDPKQIFASGRKARNSLHKTLQADAEVAHQSSLGFYGFLKSTMSTPWNFLRVLKNWQDHGHSATSRKVRCVNNPLDEMEEIGDRASAKKKGYMSDVRTESEVTEPIITAVVKNNTLFPADAPIAPRTPSPKPADKSVHIAGEVCHMRESPYRIHKMAESGNLTQVQRLYLADPTRLKIRDLKGRTVVHAAASRNRINILEFCLEHGADLNEPDSYGNTPTHVAVESESLDALEFLLNNGADAHVLNNKQQAPLHLAIELNKVNVVQALVKFKDQIDVLQGGEHGRTALHLAAMYDFAECAEILLSQYKCCAKRPCKNGYYPIHEAAKNASAKTMEVLLRWGESIGCDRQSMMSLHDVEGNDPLHSAVNGGDIKAVKLCLENGAKISSQQHNLSTPVHLACSQGAIDIVREMFIMQPDEKFNCLSIADVQNMTPLHCAAMFDHAEIVEYLVAEGALIDAVDREQRTALLLAASRAGWRTATCLIQIGASTDVKDNNNRNVLHYIVMHGGCLEDFALLMQQQLRITIEDRLNEKDINGCTPMHYASRDGYYRSIQSLIKLGATINMKNNDHQSPLHFAARYGRYNTVRQLLASEKGPFIINETDGCGLTALHIACQNGHTRVVQLLLAKGALIHRAHDGRTPFHHAAENGYTQTMDLLLCIHSHLLDQIDKDGNTAFHLAAKSNKAVAITYLLDKECKFVVNMMEETAVDIALMNKHHEAAMALATHEQRWTELLRTPSRIYCCVCQSLIAQMPEVFMAVLNKCITHSSMKKDAQDYHITYNFRLLQGPRDYASVSQQPVLPLPAINTMVQHGRVELLSHPVSQRYLHMKWHAYGMYFHLANLFVYMFFLAFVTSFAARLMSIHRANSASTDIFQAEPICYINAAVITSFAVASALKELFQLYQQRMKYLLDPINLLEWILYITSGIMVIPVYDKHIYDIHVIASAMAVFLAWFNFLLYLQRFDRVGLYVVMFLEILKTLIKVLLVFSILIIAFGLAFYILMSQENQPAFYNVPLSLMRVFSMMLGDIDYLGSYVGPIFTNHTGTADGHRARGAAKVGTSTSALPFPVVSILFLAVFMVFMPILLMNLLIGLAVGDIEAVRRNAQLKRIAMQVELHTELERKLPHMLLDRVDKEEVVEYPNNPCHCPGFWFMLTKYLGAGYKSTMPDVTVEHMQEEDVIYEEMVKQKKRMKEIHKVLDLQQKLLRLIIQKMEIKTEADDFDEGGETKDARPLSSKGSSYWKSPNFYRKLKSSMAFSQFNKKSFDTDK